MNEDLYQLTEKNRKKAVDAVDLLKASLEKLPPYDPAMINTPDDQEPYDALSDRFMRSVEVCLKFFRSYERYMYGESSDTVRNLLNRMEKLGFISSTRRWMEMREMRNRIVHDYLPEKVQELYDLIMTEYGGELKGAQDNLRSLEVNS